MVRKIGIDARLLRVRRGMGNALRSLLLALAANPPNGLEFYLYIDAEPDATLALDEPHFHWRHIGSASYPLWEQFLLPPALKRDRIHTLYSPANSGPIYLPKSVERYVLTIHDVIFLDPAIDRENSLKQRLQNRYYRWCVPRTAKRATTILTDSQYSRERIAEALGLSVDDLSVVPLAYVEPFGRNLWRGALDNIERYFIAPGAEDPRKNTAGLLEAFASARKEYGLAARLIVYGLSDSARKQMSVLNDRLGIAGDVELLPHIPDARLLELFSGALALVFPSKYEGFGLPPLEAMSCGLPVISSNATSIPEVTGDAALLFDPTDCAGLARLMSRVEREPSLRESFSEAGLRRAALFTPQRYAQRMLSVLQEA